MANSKLEIVDSVIRDLLKQNAALLELLAYGDSVYPTDDEFEEEHKRFVDLIRRVLINTEFFVVSVIYGADPELPVLSTFGSQDSPGREASPTGGASQLLLNQSDVAGGGVVASLNEWAKRCDVYILPYVVRDHPRVRDTVKRDGVLQALSILSEESLLDEFLHTRAGLRGTFSDDSLGAGYFSAYACIGINKANVKGLNKDAGVVITPLLLETLMIFYQMSWSNREIIRRDRLKASQARNQEMAEMYAKTREPLEKLVVQLQGAMQPLNELQSILAPVRGLFGSNIVGARFFEGPRQRFKLRDEEITIEIAHDFIGFSALSHKEQIKRAAEQIAVVVLQAFGVIEASQRPLWEFLKFTLRFGDKYKSVATILLEEYPDLFQHELSSFRDSDEVDRILPRIKELFELVKYWFHRAGKAQRPMRADYLVAGLGLVFPVGSGRKVDAPGLMKNGKGAAPEDTAFWVLSKRPLDTLAGLEALCHEYGELESATLTFVSERSARVATLVLRFAISAKDPIETRLNEVIASCRTNDGQTSFSRGSMAPAVLSICGEVPQLRDESDGRAGTLFVEGPGRSVAMKFEGRAIQVDWKAPPPKRSEL